MVAEVDAVVVVDTRELAVRHLDAPSSPRVHFSHLDHVIPVLGGVVEEVRLDHGVVCIHYISVEDLPLRAPFVVSH